ncbi:MAG TPA: DHHA1 domain-containing protein, partial [Candidatus Binatia bacterium]|nr:DHHA1 domain-containing protein [Candidatus Binatia bacterium]
SRQQRQELMQLLGLHLLRGASEKQGYRVVTQAFDDKEPEDLKLLAAQLVQKPGVIALLGLSGEKARLVFARAEQGPGAMNELLKSALQVLGNATGGGSAQFAQGGGASADIERVQQALARAERLLLAQIH